MEHKTFQRKIYYITELIARFGKISNEYFRKQQFPIAGFLFGIFQVELKVQLEVLLIKIRAAEKAMLDCLKFFVEFVSW